MSAHFPAKLPLKSAKVIPSSVRRSAAVTTGNLTTPSFNNSNNSWIYCNNNIVSDSSSNNNNIAVVDDPSNQRPTTSSSSCSSSSLVPRASSQALNLSRDKTTATVAIGGIGAAVSREVGKIVESSLRELLGRGPTRHLPSSHPLQPSQSVQHDLAPQDQRKVNNLSFNLKYLF